MSVWRQKAIECLPELRKEFEDPDVSIYGVFMELLPAAVEFHKTNNTGRLHIRHWVRPDVYNDIRGLLERRGEG
jgi:hypothetical protein